MLLPHCAQYRSLVPSLALLGPLIHGVDGRPVSRAAAARAVACEYLHGPARLYASVTDMARVTAALRAAKITPGRRPRVQWRRRKGLPREQP